MVQKRVVTLLPDNEELSTETPADILAETYERLNKLDPSLSYVDKMGRLLLELKRFVKTCGAKWPDVEKSARELAKADKAEATKKGIPNR